MESQDVVLRRPGQVDVNVIKCKDGKAPVQNKCSRYWTLRRPPETDGAFGNSTRMGRAAVQLWGFLYQIDWCGRIRACVRLPSLQCCCRTPSSTAVLECASAVC